MDRNKSLLVEIAMSRWRKWLNPQVANDHFGKAFGNIHAELE
jgi:hypothetical protein